MFYLSNFARTEGSKDKKPRKRIALNAGIGAGVGSGISYLEGLRTLNSPLGKKIIAEDAKLYNYTPKDIQQLKRKVLAAKLGSGLASGAIIGGIGTKLYLDYKKKKRQENN